MTNVSRQMFEEATPRNFQTDRGREFYNKDVLKLYSRSIILIIIVPIHRRRLASLQWLNRTLKGKLWKHFALIGKHRWIDDNGLKKIVLEII